MSDLKDLKNKPVTRRGLLKCAAWAGTGVVWTVQSGVLSSVDLLSAAQAAEKPMLAGLSFVQISDSHIGFSKEPNPTPEATLQSALDQIRALPHAPEFIVHTGDVSQLSKASEFDTAQQLISGLGRTVHYVPGEHDVINDNGAAFFQRFNGSADKKWYSFDAQGVHFVALSNVLDLQAGGFGRLGNEQLEWLEQDLKGKTSSTPIVVLAHMPLWTVYKEWGWGTDDAPQALSYLKKFGSVSVLNGHIHQVMQKTEGNVTFHTARSTAFPQPAPGSAPSPGPMKVPSDVLRSTLGIATVTQHMKKGPLAVTNEVLAGASAAAAPAAAAAVSSAPASKKMAASGGTKVAIGNFVFVPPDITVAAGTTLIFVNEDDVPHTVIGADPGSPLRSGALDTDMKYEVKLDKPGTFKYFCSLHPHMTGTVTVTG